MRYVAVLTLAVCLAGCGKKTDADDSPSGGTSPSGSAKSAARPAGFDAEWDAEVAYTKQLKAEGEKQLATVKKSLTNTELKELDDAMAVIRKDPGEAMREDNRRTIRGYSTATIDCQSWWFATDREFAMGNPQFKKVARIVWDRSPQTRGVDRSHIDRQSSGWLIRHMIHWWVHAEPESRDAVAAFFLQNQSVRDITPKLRDAIKEFGGGEAITNGP